MKIVHAMQLMSFFGQVIYGEEGLSCLTPQDNFDNFYIGDFVFAGWESVNGRAEYGRLDVPPSWEISTFGEYRFAEKLIFMRVVD